MGPGQVWTPSFPPELDTETRRAEGRVRLNLPTPTTPGSFPLPTRGPLRMGKLRPRQGGRGSPWLPGMWGRRRHGQHGGTSCPVLLRGYLASAVGGRQADGFELSLVPQSQPAPPARVLARTEGPRGCPALGRPQASSWLSQASPGMARTRGRCECRGAHWRNRGSRLTKPTWIFFHLHAGPALNRLPTHLGPGYHLGPWPCVPSFRALCHGSAPPPRPPEN